ncbi:hypothetical protein Gpo141_00007669 [Globisporangium polare]
MQAIFTLALVLNALLGGCAGETDANSSPASMQAPSSADAAPQAATHSAAQTHAEVRLNALGGNAPATIIARRNVDGDFSYQHPRFSAGRQGQPPPRKINT